MKRLNRNTITMIALTLLLGLLADVASAAPASIRLKDSARVSGRKVLLRDVARIDHVEPAIEEQLGGIELGTSPNPGFSRYIPRQTIESRIRALGLTSDDMTLSGAEGVTVQVKSVRIRGEELLHLGKEFLDGELAGLGGEYTIETVRNHAGVLVPVGNGMTAFDVKWHHTPRSTGIVSLDIQVMVDGDLYSTVPVQFKIRRFDYVLVAMEEINRSEPFTKSNTSVERVEITQVKGNIARSVKEMALYLSKQRIEPGTVIRQEAGYLPDIVQRGQAVSVTVKKGALSIRSRGTARQSGAFGETIEVLNPDSGNIFKSTVVGNGQVMVKL